MKTNLQLGLFPSIMARYSPDAAGPMTAVSWFGAAAYCNWLSEQEGLPPDQWCYYPNETGAYDEGMTIPADAFKRTGYRLPTEAEWEYACRSGTVTSRYYGLSVDLVSKYAWNQANSQEHAWAGGRLLPNDLGLFDMLGNVFEWVQDREVLVTKANDDINTSEFLYKKATRIIRGGTFANLPDVVRSASRNYVAPSVRNVNYGFRLARTYH